MMPEDGIDFLEANDFPCFIEDKTLAEIAEKVRELITKYPNAYTRFRESVKKCEKRQRDQIAAQLKWERKRREHARRAIKKPRLLDKDKDPPEDGWRFQTFRGQDVADFHAEGELSDIMAAWFPPDLSWQSRPKVELPPLPPHGGEMKPCERETALAAIFDCYMKGERKIAAGLNLTHYKDLIGFESPVPIDSKHDGLVKQIPKADECHLWIWLEQIEEDLQARPALAKSAASAYEILLALPEHRAIKGPEMVSELYTGYKINVDESTFRKNIVPALKPYGLEHGPAGYHIQSSSRRPQEQKNGKNGLPC